MATAHSLHSQPGQHGRRVQAHLDAATLGEGMERITLRVPAARAFHGAVRLVVGGIASRSRLSYEQVDEIQLAVEELIAHRELAADVIVVEADVDDASVSILVGPFPSRDGAPGLRVVERLVERVRLVDRDGWSWVELTTSAAPGAGDGSP